MPIRFSISESREGGESLARELEELSYRLFDLRPMANRAAWVMDRQNRYGVAAGTDKDGNRYADLAPYTIKHRGGSGPPLSPRRGESWVEADFHVTVDPGGFDEMVVRGRWPNSPWLGAHVLGKHPSGHMPVRNPVGMRPESMEWLAEEFREWLREILEGKPDSGPSGPPDPDGYTPSPRGRGGPGTPSPQAPPTPSRAPAKPAGGVASSAPPTPSEAARRAITPDDPDASLDFSGRSGSLLHPGVEVAYGEPVEYTRGELPGRIATIERLSRDILGPEGTPERIALLAGIPPDATKVMLRENDYGQKGIDIEITTPTAHLHRTVWRDIDYYTGNVATKISNNSFTVEKGHRGKGLGAMVLARQVREAAAAGFKRIDTYAARDDDPEEGMNGYITWPKLGYDGPIPYAVHEKLPPEFSGYTRVSHLMATQKGREFWEIEGKSTNMSFDLTPGSYSRRVLDETIKRKGLQP